MKAIVAGGLIAGAVPAFGSIEPANTQGTSSDAPAAQTRAQRLMGDIAPKLAELTDGVLFGDVWERPQLAKRDRSLVTVRALIALNRPDQLRSHLALARENGLSEEELVETITHLAFYSGWPNAVTAVSIAREVFSKPRTDEGGSSQLGSGPTPTSPWWRRQAELPDSKGFVAT